jgi:hypothetical protein
MYLIFKIHDIFTHFAVVIKLVKKNRYFFFKGQNFNQTLQVSQISLASSSQHSPSHSMIHFKITLLSTHKSNKDFCTLFQVKFCNVSERKCRSLNYRKKQNLQKDSHLLFTKIANNQLKEYLSSSLPLRYGFPQGSVLGLLHFSLYVNDIPQLTQGRAIMYAHDTSVHNIGREKLCLCLIN